ncbi:hypothetical protein GCM10009677_52160 [Sphaerisporangium rubeum]|uniref:Uncharacterized protein n=1 Tax=Sphaerisporangium rubeum TaxID=321317 RepID=A0A7X0M760_9ACTN|nr:hypothetical protein [Sphaerisporangium rubeum]MBB6473957.1 hypothetical protein [Sphaerisporangium rubeum]
MSLLEDRYRFVLRLLLPASYLAAREEEMVAAFLDGAGGASDGDNPRPRAGEVASVAALAVRVRLAAGPELPRYQVLGRAVRRAAFAGLLFHAVLSCVWFAGFLVAYGLGDVPGALGPVARGEAGSAERLLDVVWGFAGLLGVAAFAALARGRAGAAKVLAVLSLVWLYGGVLGAPGLTGGEAARITATHTLLFGLPVAALAAGYHRGAAAPRRPVWLAVLPVVAAVPLYALLSVLNAGTALAGDVESTALAWAWMDETGLACLALLVTAACVPARARGEAHVALSLVLLTAPVALARAVDLTGPPAGPGAVTATQVVQLCALLLCGAYLLVTALRAMPAREPAAVRTPDGETAGGP